MLRAVVWEWDEPPPEADVAAFAPYDVVLLPDVMYDDAAVERLREQVASTSKEMEEAARARSVPLPNDWATPLEMATRRTPRQVETFAASMEAEVASLGSQLQETQAAHQEEMQMAKDGAKMLLKELENEKKSKQSPKPF